MDQRRFDLASAAVDAAVRGGATYADARVVATRYQSMGAQNAEVDELDSTDAAGIGVRALVGSSWGFSASNTLTVDAAEQVGRRAVAVGRASARVPGDPTRLADVGVHVAHWDHPVGKDPFAVPVSERADLLQAVTGRMHREHGIPLARASVVSWDTSKWFVSSEGSRISQRLVETGGGITAMAVGEDQTQVRSYPQSFGDYHSGGWEVVEGYDLLGNCDRVADEANALLTAPECPSATTDLILGGSQVALQIHESVGHAIELDRILGWEAAFAGTSFLELDRLGELQYGSPLMRITADATIPGAMGTFGYDDEGTPASSTTIVDEGRWVGVLSGRDSAAVAGVPPGGMVRGDGFNRLPMVRMTNVGLLPGEDSLESIIADTDDGVLMDTNRSWSIDDRRRNFQFGCEIAWEVKGGKRGRMLRNPTYTGITPVFWGSLDRLAGGDDWRVWGTPNCGKGQPVQTMHTAHQAAPARFAGVRVGVRG